MKNIEILSKVDHTSLSTTLTWEELKKEIDFALLNSCVCLAITPNYVERASKYIKQKNGTLEVSAAISFPRGDTTTAVKVFEIRDSLAKGATEIDAVTNLQEVKNGNWQYIESEYLALREAAKGVPLKIIIETSELEEFEKIKLAQLITKCRIDFIKTSTGFSKGGATKQDIELLKNNIGQEVQIKASGGITTRESAVEFLEMGVSRIGTKFSREFVADEKD